MAELIGPYETGEWIPVSTILASRPYQWPGLDLTAQFHRPWRGTVPPLRCHLITAFQRPGRVRRYLDGPWQEEDVARGDVSFIPRATDSIWEWNDQLENIHFHVSDRYLSRIAGDVFGRDDVEIALVDRLKICDPSIQFMLEMLAREAQYGGQAEQLYVDAIGTHLCVHILRHYSKLQISRPRPAEGLGAIQASRISNYIEANISRSVSIAEIAEIAHVSPFHFARQFKICFGSTPHKYITTRRLERAYKMISRDEAPLKQIAARCGFYDQAHMTRLFKNEFGYTPREIQTKGSRVTQSGPSG